MGGLVEASISDAADSFLLRDVELAEKVRARDANIDELETIFVGKKSRINFGAGLKIITFIWKFMKFFVCSTNNVCLRPIFFVLVMRASHESPIRDGKTSCTIHEGEKKKKQLYGT